MKILLIVSLCLISDGGDSNEVTGYSGGGVLIKCKYHTNYTEDDKYFCNGSGPNCSDQIKTENYSRRFSLFDDKTSAEIKVMMRDLTAQDTGTYYCAVGRNPWTNISTPVELKIKEGVTVAREVTAYAGTRSNIKCKYENEYKFNPKSFYNIDTDQWRFNPITTKKSAWAHEARFSIHDNRSAEFFSVFIRELTVNDTGTYACAVAVSDEIEILTVVKLNVTKDLPNQRPIIKSIYVGEDLNVSCKYPESHRSDAKFLCKRPRIAACSYTVTVKENRKHVDTWNLSLHDDREKLIFYARFNNVTEQDSGEYWCGAEVNWTSEYGYKVYFTQIILTVTNVCLSTLVPTQYSSSWSTPTSPERGFPVSTVITVSVSLLVLLIGIIFLIVTLHGRQKMQGPKTITRPRDTNGDYENDPNVLHFHSSQMTNQSESVYQSLNPNINQSDSVYQSLNPNQSDSVYQSLKPNTNQSDSVYQSLNPNQSESVYQSLNPNTNQSDSVYQILMLNRPTGHSQSRLEQNRAKFA